MSLQLIGREQARRLEDLAAKCLVAGEAVVMSDT